jgi:hypothetical protein
VPLARGHALAQRGKRAVDLKDVPDISRHRGQVASQLSCVSVLCRIFAGNRDNRRSEGVRQAHTPAGSVLCPQRTGWAMSNSSSDAQQIGGFIEAPESDESVATGHEQERVRVLLLTAEGRVERLRCIDGLERAMHDISYSSAADVLGEPAPDHGERAEFAYCP